MPQTKSDLKALSLLKLHTDAGVADLDAAFLARLLVESPDLHQKLVDYRSGSGPATEASSYLLMDLAKHMEAILAELFDIDSELADLNGVADSASIIAAFKKHYVLREAKRGLKNQDSIEDFSVLDEWLEAQLPDYADRQLAIAKWGVGLLQDGEQHQASILRLTHWCIAALASEEGKHATTGWVLFKLPQKLHFDNLVNEEPVVDDPWGRQQANPDNFRQRDGFELTDQRMSARDVYDEVHYCVYCHKNDGDFCSTGFPVKKKDPSLGYKISPAGDVLAGCPLEERISEMHLLKRDGFSLAALAMVMRDNPMCAVTGHRICNDCMKACIYQKQDPVNIPQIETRVLTDILNLPWGVEIYDLLVRWNPLRQQQHQPKPYNGLKVCVMGMGPAGFSLAHHLLMEGFAVVGLDGLKIEPLDRQHLMQPIKHFSDLTESLAERVMGGFGGVAEYGITVRWDKNFLKLILISLMRRPLFQIFGSVRFGGTLTVDDVWKLGFDHLALAVGAGLPKELMIPNSLAPGMRQANDFLMSLQLTGAAKASSLANLQVRLPAVVIGGGLTGVDTATEVQAYYLVQIEKVTQRYQHLVDQQGEAKVRAVFSEHDLTILDEFVEHYQQLQQEREAAKKQGRDSNTIGLLRQWGGVTIAYRRTMQQSPAYQRNHEELTKALEEGIYYAEGLEPDAVLIDEAGHCKALRCTWRIMDESGDWMTTDEQQALPARSIFVATGAKPNVAYEFEHQGTFARDGFEYQRFDNIDGQLQQAADCRHVKSPSFGAFTSYERDHHRVSFLGDTHSVFHGSVVKAVASAARVYPEITTALQQQASQGDLTEHAAFHDKMKLAFDAHVVSVTTISADYIEVVVHAPLAAAQFAPGQFYRLQNYETLAKRVGNTQLQMEALALMAIPVENNPDHLRFIVQQQGVSSLLAARLEPGEPVALMGPSGVCYDIPQNPQTTVIIGSDYALMYALSSGAAYREAGHKLVLIAVLDNDETPFYQDTIEQYCDAIVWGQGDVAAAIDDYQQQHPEGDLALSAAASIMVLGNSDMLRQVQCYRKGESAAVFNSSTRWLASVYGPMQCMLKGVCAQCLQWQIDPATGERTKAVYACSWHHQPIDIIDINHIDERLDQNRMQQTLTKLWLHEVLGN